MYKNINCKSALNRINNKFLPYKWDLNIYRGCSHKCCYCYALYSHHYLSGSRNFYKEIYIKKNIVNLLDESLRKKKNKKELINIGGVTDSYQSIEKKEKIMRNVLKIMIKHEAPITISTKSSLIIRDLDLLKKLSKRTFVNVAFTITTLDEKKRAKIEPKTTPSIKRFEALKILSQNNIRTGLHFMPILPFITDTKKNIENIFKLAEYCGVNYALCGMLNLRGETRKSFLNFIKKNYPSLLRDYTELFSIPNKRKKYKQALFLLIKHYRNIYNVKNYTNPQRIINSLQTPLNI